MGPMVAPEDTRFNMSEQGHNSDPNIFDSLVLDSLRPTNGELDDLLQVLEADQGINEYPDIKDDLLQEALISPTTSPVTERKTVDPFDLDGSHTSATINDLKEGSNKLDEYIQRSLNYMQPQNTEPVEPEFNEYGQPVASGKRRRAQRRNSMPTMHTTYEAPATNQLPPHLMDYPAPFPKPEGYDGGNSFSSLGQGVPMSGNDVFAHTEAHTQPDPPGKRRRAERRNSMPTMHVHYDPVSEQGAEQQSYSQHQGGYGSSEWGGQPTATNIQGEGPRRTFNRRASASSYFDNNNNNQDLNPVAEHQEAQGNLPVVGTDEMLIRLKGLMKRSVDSQKALQNWDKKNGLPRSHSQTMVNSSRSRKQLQEGVILPKWDGTPLINEETELGKPKPRSGKTGDGDDGFSSKMKRRMSAPASCNYSGMF